MKKIVYLLLIVFLFSSCSEKQSVYEKVDIDMEKQLKLKIDDEYIEVEWSDNDSVDELIKLVNNEPLFINMSQYGGFEQVGSLGKNIKRNDTQITTKIGDIMLYSGNQIVIFYGSNTWSYTRLGKVVDSDLNKMKKLLEIADVIIQLYIE